MCAVEHAKAIAGIGIIVVIVLQRIGVGSAYAYVAPGAVGMPPLS